MSGNQVYTPRTRLSLNGTPLQGVESVSWTAASAQQVGRFNFSKVMVPSDTFPFVWWQNTASKDMLIQIDMALDGVSFVPVFTGTVDSHNDAPVTGTIQASGRDLASVMMDTRTLSTDADMIYYPQTITMHLSATAAGGSVQSKFSSSLLLVDDQTGEQYPES